MFAHDVAGPNYGPSRPLRGLQMRSPVPAGRRTPEWRPGPIFLAIFLRPRSLRTRRHVNVPPIRVPQTAFTTVAGSTLSTCFELPMVSPGIRPNWTVMSVSGRVQTGFRRCKSSMLTRSRSFFFSIRRAGSAEPFPRPARQAHASHSPHRLRRPSCRSPPPSSRGPHERPTLSLLSASADSSHGRHSGRLSSILSGDGFLTRRRLTAQGIVGPHRLVVCHFWLCGLSSCRFQGFNGFGRAGPRFTWEAPGHTPYFGHQGKKMPYRR